MALSDEGARRREADAGEGRRSRELLLSICILSCNRPAELRRCLDTIDCAPEEGVEIVISDDGSPRAGEIAREVAAFGAATSLPLRFHPQQENIGYDRNIGRVIALASGRHVVLMSDDDVFVPGALTRLVARLRRGPCPLAFSPYLLGTARGRAFAGDRAIPPGQGSIERYLYAAVLFSGLVFERRHVRDLDTGPFHNLLYGQLFLFCAVLLRHGGRYHDDPLVEVIGDGEIGFGRATSGSPEALLADRTALQSPLAYHRGLIATLRLVDRLLGTTVFARFEREYALRSFGRLVRARRQGRRALAAYWRGMLALDLRVHPVAWLYVAALYLFGVAACEAVLRLPRRLLLRRRARHPPRVAAPGRREKGRGWPPGPLGSLG